MTPAKLRRYLRHFKQEEQDKNVRYVFVKTSACEIRCTKICAAIVKGIEYDGILSLYFDDECITMIKAEDIIEINFTNWQNETIPLI